MNPENRHQPHQKCFKGVNVSKIDNIRMMNDLVIRTEKGEITWDKTEYAGFYILKNSNGTIQIGKISNGNIGFKVIGSHGAIVTDDEYFINKDEDLQVYKVSNVLWSLVKDLSTESNVDFLDILNFLEKEE